VSEPLLGALYCHCKRCQRRSGTGVSVSALVSPGSYRITAGENLIRSWTAPEGGCAKSFCAECGSQLFTANPDDPDVRAVRMGTFDDDPGVRPGVHQFTTYAPPWAPVPDAGLPRFPERLGQEASSPPDS